MASAIDPTKPEDGVPAKKVNLRTNLQTAQTELDHGGFAEGLTPVNYGPPASSMVTDHLAAIDTTLGTAIDAFSDLVDTPATYAAQGTKFVKVKADETGLEFAQAPGGGGAGLTGLVDVVADYGATGNGSTDDTTEIQNALNSGAAIVFFPAGTYKISTRLNVTPGVKLMGAGPRKSILDGRLVSGGDDGVLYVIGSLTSLPGLASATAEGDAWLELASSAIGSVAQGDYISVRDTTLESLDEAEGKSHHDGFFGLVASAETNAGHKIGLFHPVPRALPAPRTNGPLGNVQLKKLDNRGLVIEDLGIWGTAYDATSGGTGGGSSTIGQGIWLENVAHVHLVRVHVIGGGHAGIAVRNSAFVTMTNCHVTELTGQWSPTTWYGIHIYGSGFVFATNSQFVAARHGVTFEGLNGGMPTHDVVLNGCFIASVGASDYLKGASQPNVTFRPALDWHAGTYNTKVVNSIVHGSANIRGFGGEISGCELYGQKDDYASGLIGAGSFGPPLDWKITNNRMYVFADHWQDVGLCLGLRNDDNDFPNAEKVAGFGSIEFADNTIVCYDDTTDPLVSVEETSAVATAGTIRIRGNHVIHSAASSTQPFLRLNMPRGLELIVEGNVLPPNVSLGTYSGFSRKVIGPNIVAGYTTYSNLPTSNPGGSGRLWNDGGTLKVT